MAIKIIRCVPDPVLRKKAERITVIDKRVLILIKDMMDTLADEQGVGLAAPQVGRSLRLIVMQMPKEQPYAIINPAVVKRIGEREVTEGCLSIPGYQGRINRSVAVTVKGLDSQGKPIRIKATGLLSQALEHEIDHLDGILYIDHLKSPEKLYKLESKHASPEVSDKAQEQKAI